MPDKITAEQAIEESIATNSIVHLDYDEMAQLTLGAECDDNASTRDEDGNAVWEYWGGEDDETGDSWRVHLHLGHK